MPLLAAFLLMSQGTPAQGSASVRVEVPILHVRPSKVSALLNQISTDAKGPTVSMTPDDLASTLTLVGAKADVEEMKGRIALFDNAPRKLRLALRVESPLDHADWKGEVEATNNVLWTGEDEATGIRLVIDPRLNADDTCTLHVRADSADASSVSVVFRLKRGEEETFTLPVRGARPMSGKDERSPRFSVRFLGD